MIGVYVWGKKHKKLTLILQEKAGGSLSDSLLSHAGLMFSMFLGPGRLWADIMVRRFLSLLSTVI